MLSRRAFAGAIIGTVVITTRSACAADTYPSRPIRVISPFPAGSASDTVGRVVLDKVSQILGQAMVVEAKPGAGGIVGFADVAKADPDGYTLVTSSTSMGTGMVLHSHLPYDPGQGFRFGGHVRGAAERAGRFERERLQDGRRSRRGGKGEARHADLCFGRDRLLVAYGGRETPPRRQDRCPSRAVQRERSDRSDGRTHRFLFHSAGGGGLGARQRQARQCLRSVRRSACRCCPTCRPSRKPAIRAPSSISGSDCRRRRRRPRDIVDKLHDATEKALPIPIWRRSWPSSASSRN